MSIANLQFPLLLLIGLSALPVDVLQYGMVEQSLKHSGDYDNPYTELAPTARLIGPDHKQRTVALFWDGDKTWRFRFSPDQTGTWTWSVDSRDAGLSGRAGEFRVVPSQRHGGIRPMQGHPHHFAYQDGTPLWWMGDTAWALDTDYKAEHHTWPQVKHYIDTRAAQGFNVVHSMLLSEAGWGNSGGNSFHDLTAETINPGYWREVDKRVQYLNGKGITAGLVLAWADKGRNTNNWSQFPSQQSRERYARYVTARYGAFNVYFVVCGEWDLGARRSGLSRKDYKATFVDVGNVIKNSDPHARMIGIHPGGGGSVTEFDDSPWMSFGDYQQNYRRLHAAVLDSRKHRRPVVNAEYAYFLRDRDGDGRTDKNNSADLQMIRHATWDLVMAGGYFVTGFGTTYFGGNRDPGPFDVDAAKNDPWEEDVQQVRKLFTGLKWWRLEPHDELIQADVERGQDERRRQVIAPPRVAFWALSQPGQQYVFYTRGYEGEYRLNLGEAANGAYRLQQFDPRTGELTEAGTHSGNGPMRYTPPDKRDWVLLVTRSREG